MHESMQNKFEIEEIKNSIISSRCKHTTFYYTKNAKLYIYGGYGIDNFTKTIKVLNDFYTFETVLNRDLLDSIDCLTEQEDSEKTISL